MMMKRNILFFLLLVTCVLCVFTTGSYATVNVDLQYELNLSGQYDSNIYLTSDDEESDWISIISPSFTVNLYSKYWQAMLSYSPSVYNYLNHSENNYISHKIGFSYLNNISEKLTLSVYSKFDKTQELYELNSETEAHIYSPSDYTTRKKRTYHSQYSGQLKLNYEMDRKEFFFVGYNHYRNWEQDENIEEGSRFNPFWGLKLLVSDRLYLSLDGSYIKGDFYGESEDFHEIKGSLRFIKEITKHFTVNVAYAHTYMDYVGDSADYQVYAPSAGFIYKFSKDASLGMDIGYYKQEKEKDEEEKGINLNLDVNKKWKIKKGSVEFKYISGYEETYFGSENLGFTVYHGGKLTYLYDFTRHLSNLAYIDYRLNKYTDVDPERRDNILSLKDELTYKVNKWMNLLFSYEYRWLNSNIDVNDYKEHKVMVSIVLYQIKRIMK